MRCKFFAGPCISENVTYSAHIYLSQLQLDPSNQFHAAIGNKQKSEQIYNISIRFSRCFTRNFIDATDKWQSWSKIALNSSPNNLYKVHATTCNIVALMPKLKAPKPKTLKSQTLTPTLYILFRAHAKLSSV